jgi:hypothetical protein
MGRPSWLIASARPRTDVLVWRASSREARHEQRAGVDLLCFCFCLIDLSSYRRTAMEMGRPTRQQPSESARQGRAIQAVSRGHAKGARRYSLGGRPAPGPGAGQRARRARPRRLSGVKRVESLPSFFLLGAIGSACSYRFHMIFFLFQLATIGSGRCERGNDRASSAPPCFLCSFFFLTI